MNLKPYAWNIFEIAKENNEDLGAARRMHVNNISQGGGKRRAPIWTTPP